MKYFALIVLLLVVALAEARPDVVKGPNSAGKDDSLSTVECPAGMLGLKCSCEPENYCDGSYFKTPTTCVAVKRSTRHNAGHVNAVAECMTMTVNKMTAAWARGPSETCPEKYKLTGCEVYSAWAQNWPHAMKPIVNGNKCSASHSCGKCKVQATCAFVV